MNDAYSPEALAILARILNREASSLLQYLRGSGSWVDARSAVAASSLEQLADAEERAARVIADILRRAKIPPAPPRFDQRFSSLNYLALDRLLPILLDHQRALLVEQQKDAAVLDADLRSKLQPLLEVKRKSIAEIEKLTKELHAAKTAAPSS